MPTKLKSDTARTNGAKSQGPATPEGRAKSSHNSLRHGLSSKTVVVLPTEDPQQFEILLEAHITQFNPQTDLELELVEAMAVARWRLRRIVALETNLYTTELVRRDYMDRSPELVTGEDRLAHIFFHLSDTPSLTMLLRYERQQSS